MPGGESAFIVKPETRFELGFAALAYPDNRVVFDYAERFAPNLEPPGRALLLGVQDRYAARALDHKDGYRSQYHDTGYRGEDGATTGAGDGHHEDRDR